MAGTHARFAPSSAKRIALCPASLLLNEQMPDNPSYDAAYGTAAHDIAERCLTEMHSPTRHLGEVVRVEESNGQVFEITVDDEMVAGISDYIAWVWNLPGEHYVETRVNVSRWTPIDDQFGTSDHAACQPKKLTITDLKMGKGVKVYAKENYQGIMYALGFIDEFDWLYDFEEVVIRIAQPRLDHFDEWVTTKADLFKIGAYLRSRFEMALQPNAPFGPDEDGCKFCKVAATCRALADKIAEERALAFDAVFEEDFKLPLDLLEIEDLVSAMRMKPLYDLRMKAIGATLRKKLLAGEEVPDMKMVAGRGARVWKDQTQVERHLLGLGLDDEKLWEKTFVSPSKAEKLLKGPAKKSLGDFIEKKPGTPQMAFAEDSRPALADTALSAFSDIPDDDEIDDAFSD